MIKHSSQEYITIIYTHTHTHTHTHTPNTGTSQHVKQKLTTIKGETDSNTIIVGDYHHTYTNEQIMDTENK